MLFFSRFGKTAGSSMPKPVPSYNCGVEILLRPARVDDFEKLWSLDQECFPAGISYSRPELAAYIRASQSFTLIAELVAPAGPGWPVSVRRPKQSPAAAGEGVLGFLIAEMGRRGMGHVITLDVASKARRFGVGSRLLLAAERGLRAGKCRRVRLEAAVDNLGALSFYKSRQYHVVRTIPRYYSNGVDAFVFEKDLLSSDPSS
jgi:ribosomal protein S18 acetylase RimI-like enzyme